MNKEERKDRHWKCLLSVAASAAASGLVPILPLVAVLPLDRWSWSRSRRRRLLLGVLLSLHPGLSLFPLRKNNSWGQDVVDRGRRRRTRSSGSWPAQGCHYTVDIQSLEDPLAVRRCEVRPQGHNLQNESCLVLVTSLESGHTGEKRSGHVLYHSC